MTLPNTPSQDQSPSSEAKINTSETTRTLTLLPPTYKNETFDKNIAYFKTHQTALYNMVINHTCSEYRLCSNPDGSPNILDMQNKTPLYHVFTLKEIIASAQKAIDNLHCGLRINESFICGGKERWQKDNPIQFSMLTKLYKTGIFYDLKLTPESLSSFQVSHTDYLPLIRICGIGLGYHLTALIQKRTVSYMTIYEPNIDLFYISLYTVPWQLVFKYFDAKGKGVNLVVGGTPNEAINKNMIFIRQRLMPLTSYFFRLNHLNSELIQQMVSKEPQTDAVEREQADAGWYEDQRSGFYFGARNIKKGTAFFSGKKASRFLRAFVIGSGPSLNDTIDYIKTHQQDALIISCGSAITPLLKAGIVPDYEVIQERLWHISKLEERHDLEVLKKISLLKLNVVSPQVDKYYKETLIFQKFRDPGSSFLGEKYAVTTAVNPTVTNSGIAMCAALGAKEVFLFGVDYGAPLHSTKMHATNTIYDELAADDSVDSKTQFDLPGNLGSVIRTDTILSWSLRTTEMKIAEFPKIKWFNVGEGALISGAVPMSLKALPKKFSEKIHKKSLRAEISKCFNDNYSSAKILERLKSTQMQQVDDYFKAILGFTDSTPETREEVVYVLSLLYEAVNTGQYESHFLPASLLAYGFKQFITDVYIQSAMEPDDASAAQFFETSKGILIEYTSAIEKDLARILNYIALDSETELLTHGSAEYVFASK
jgi:hypothetical protein